MFLQFLQELGSRNAISENYLRAISKSSFMSYINKRPSKFKLIVEKALIEVETSKKVRDEMEAEALIAAETAKKVQYEMEAKAKADAENKSMFRFFG